MLSLVVSGWCLCICIGSCVLMPFARPRSAVGHPFVLARRDRSFDGSTTIESEGAERNLLSRENR